MRLLTALLLLAGLAGQGLRQAQAQAQAPPAADERIPADSLDDELIERLRNLPNIEIGRGITFQSRNRRFKTTLRFRMQNVVGLDFDRDFSLTRTEARVKRLRLRLDGYVHSPKLVYSIQLGFSSSDSRHLPDGSTNIIQDAAVYYVHNARWNIGLGQTKIKANRAQTNSSGALQFVDRSIVNGEFNLGRDFGLFGEFNLNRSAGFDLAAKGSVTLGEGRNWNHTKNGNLAYTARLELFPTGRFSAKGEVTEGDYAHEAQAKILLAAAYCFNHRATRLKGQHGAEMPEGEHRDLNSYFVDFILKYRGFAFCADFMGRACGRPLFAGEESAFVYTGCGLNVQTSYLIRRRWEIALRNSTLFPERRIRHAAGYARRNRTTLGLTRYIIGHSLKVQTDISYEFRTRAASPDYDRWQIGFQLELGI